MKMFNRKCEHMLRMCELLSVIAMLDCKSFEYPRMQLEKWWKIVLLNQFHDCIPGSSIEMVYDDAFKMYEQVVDECECLIKELLNDTKSSLDGGIQVFNPTGWSFKGAVIEIDTALVSPETAGICQLTSDRQSVLVQGLLL